MTATEFKAKCLQLLDQVHDTGERIQVTKRGKVVAELIPPKGAEPKKFAPPGFAKGLFTINGDIMAPLDVEWENLDWENLNGD